MNRQRLRRIVAATQGGAIPAIPDPTKTTYIWDTFTGADNTALESHTPDIDVTSAGWTKAVGSVACAILSNRVAYNTASTGASLYICDPGTPSINLQADCYFGQTSGGIDYLQMRYRLADKDNCFLATFGKYSGNGIYSIEELTAGTPTSRATGTFTYAANAHHVFRVEDDGTLITVTINGGNPITYSSTSKNTNTKCAVSLSMQSTITNKIAIDNLWGWKNG